MARSKLTSRALNIVLSCLWSRQEAQANDILTSARITGNSLNLNINKIEAAVRMSDEGLRRQYRRICNMIDNPNLDSEVRNSCRRDLWIIAQAMDVRRGRYNPYA